MTSKVLVCFKIMPTTPECDLNKMQKDIREKHKDKIENFKIEDVAFGIKMLKALYILEDKAGIVDKIQNEINDIENMQSVETESVTLI